MKIYLSLGLILVFCGGALSFQCLQYDMASNRCNKCSQNTHLFKGNCLYNIKHCIEYKEGLECQKCAQNYYIQRVIDRFQCRILKLSQEGAISQKRIFLQTDDVGNYENSDFYLMLNEYVRIRFKLPEQQKWVEVLDRKFKNKTQEMTFTYKKNQLKTLVVFQVFENYTSFSIKQVRQQTVDPKTQSESHQKRIQNGQNQNQKRTEHLIQQKETFLKSSSSKKDKVTRTNNFDFVYQNEQERKKDEGFLETDEFIKNNLVKKMGTLAVTGCFVNQLGLKNHYKIYYETETGQLYEAQAIRDNIRKKVFVLNFGKVK